MLVSQDFFLLGLWSTNSIILYSHMEPIWAGQRHENVKKSLVVVFSVHGVQILNSYSLAVVFLVVAKHKTNEIKKGVRLSARRTLTFTLGK